MLRADIVIAGAGIIGLSLALELHARGLSIIVADSGLPMQQASTAAAGMLAAEDPHNPVELSALSHLSVSLYPGFLARIQELSGTQVAFQTSRTLQALPGNPALSLPPELQAQLLLKEFAATTLDPHSGFLFLSEHSIDPRQLAPALIAALAATSIRTIYNCPLVSTMPTASGVIIKTPTDTIEASCLADCTGAWANSCEPDGSFKAIPIKGQMLAVALPPDLQLQATFRAEDIYIVPRTAGHSAGRAIVGATVEDIGFDKTVHPSAIDSLRQRATALVPGLARANIVDSWAGLRPATSDRLPLLGAHPTRAHHWIAAGHYRNGILLAPATARVMAQLLLEEEPAISITAFSPGRFAPSAAAFAR